MHFLNTTRIQFLWVCYAFSISVLAFTQRTGSFISDWIISSAYSEHFGTDIHYLLRFKTLVREGHLMK